MSLYRNNLKNREFDKEAPQNFDSERATMAQGPGASENHNSEAKPTPSKTDSSGCFGINQVQLENCPLIVLAVYPADSRRIEQIRLLAEKHQREELKNFRVHGLSESLMQLVEALEPYEKKTIVTFFGNPFGLSFFDRYSTVIMAYEVEADAEAAAAALLLGSL